MPQKLVCFLFSSQVMEDIINVKPFAITPFQITHFQIFHLVLLYHQ